jgi:aspartyl-tRNA synthetase
VLSEAKTPPFAIEDELQTSEDIRLKYRYLDLRRPKLHKNIRLRHQITMEVRRHLDEQGFYEIETPMLTKSTPEGARDYLVPSRVHHGHFYALPQSPQLFKQLLMVSGMDKYFQIVRCFRDEDLRADRQPEFTQVDIEISFPRMQTVFDLIEPLYARIFRLIGVDVPRPFPRMSYADAMERYGSDKPDLRFGMPITDVTEEMQTLGLDTFPGLIAEGARARTIVLPAGGGISGTRLRKINEELWLGRIVPDARASKRNLFTLKASDEAVGNLGKKGASETVARALLAKVGAQKDDTLLVGVDQSGPLAMALGILRLEMGRELKLIEERAFRFLWVTDFPLMQYDNAAQRFASLHHPFTAPLDEDAVLLDSDPGAVRAKAYDLVLNGSEIGGGSIRIHDSGMQAKIFKLLSLSDEEAKERFGFFLEALQYGTPPHGGIALGLDRTAMILAGEASIRDVIAFPKTASATDLMAGSPSPVRDEQIKDLGILVVRK